MSLSVPTLPNFLYKCKFTDVVTSNQVVQWAFVVVCVALLCQCTCQRTFTPIHVLDTWMKFHFIFPGFNDQWTKPNNLIFNSQFLQYMTCKFRTSCWSSVSWNENVILIKLFVTGCASFASTAASDNNFIKMTTLPFQSMNIHDVIPHMYNWCWVMLNSEWLQAWPYLTSANNEVSHQVLWPGGWAPNNHRLILD